MLRIKDNARTMVPAILALEEAGFSVRVVRHEGGRNWWFAESDVLELVASDPLKLLGLAKMHELRGDGWEAPDEEAHAVMGRHKLELRAD